MSGKWSDWIKVIILLFVLFFISVFKCVEDLVIVMEVCGYCGGKGRMRFCLLCW